MPVFLFYIRMPSRAGSYYLVILLLVSSPMLGFDSNDQFNIRHTQFIGIVANKVNVILNEMLLKH